MTSVLTRPTARAFAEADSVPEAVASFRELLARHRPRIDRTRRAVEQIYRFKTPERPVFQFDVKNAQLPDQPATVAWVRTPRDRNLYYQLLGILAQLQVLPESDFVPAVAPLDSGRSSLVPRLFGGEFENLDDGSVRATRYVIRDLERDLDALPQPDLDHDAEWQQVLNHARYLREVLPPDVLLVYPQMQGPLTNASRMLPQEEMLIACRTEPALVKQLCEKITRVIIDLTSSFVEAAGGFARVRPRRRGHQPAWVNGLLVDDYISVIKPQDYLALAGSSWQMMAAAFGSVFLHTCGPTILTAEIMAQLPGLAGFETAFVNGFAKTTSDLEQMKASLNGRIVMQSFELPHGEPVHDQENLTADWLQRMSQGGGFMMHASGTAEEGKRLLGKLGLNDCAS